MYIYIYMYMYIYICPTSYSTESPQNEVATPWTKARRCERTSGCARTFLRGSPWGAPRQLVSHQGGSGRWIRSWTKTLWFFEGKLQIMTTWIYIYNVYIYVYVVCIYIYMCICIYICCICIYIYIYTLYICNITKRCSKIK